MRLEVRLGGRGHDVLPGVFEKKKNKYRNVTDRTRKTGADLRTHFFPVGFSTSRKKIDEKKKTRAQQLGIRGTRVG